MSEPTLETKIRIAVAEVERRLTEWETLKPELTRLRTQQTVAVAALRKIAHMHGQARCSVTAREALATLDVPPTKEEL